MTDRPDLGLFSHAVCMTFDKRMKSGELGDAAESFEVAGVPVRRFLMGDGHLFPAGDYDWIDQDMQPRRQAWNYASAFQRVLAHAAIPRWCRPFLYMEDDAQLVPGAMEELPKVLQELTETVCGDYDLFFLGGNFLNGRVDRVSPRIIRPWYALDLHAVLINYRSFGLLRTIEPSAHRTIDGVIADMIKDGRLVAYAANPPLVYQRVGFSWNEGRIDDKRSRQLVRYTW